jgi:PAS domain S-box-containing protein
MSYNVHASSLGAGAADPFLQAFLASRLAMILIDPHQPDYPVVFANEAFCALSGYPREDVVGRGALSLLGQSSEDAGANEAARAALRAGESFASDRLLCRDATRAPSAFAVDPVRGTSGEVLYFVAVQSPAAQPAPTQRVRDLEAALARMATLLHDVDHRAKNSLQVVSSLILLKARRLQDKQARDAFLGLSERVGALSAAHRVTHAAGDPNLFSVGDFLAELIPDLAAPVGDRIAVETQAEAVAVAAGKAAPLALIVSELVTNALKHAFPDGRAGRLSVKATKPGDRLRIVIEDDGIGLEDGTPPDGEFGRTLIDMLVRQLRAQIAWENADPGTRVCVTIPLDEEEAKL